MSIASFFQKLPRDRPVLGIGAGSAFFAIASYLRWELGGISEGFGPMTLLPSILLAGLFGGIRIALAFAALSAVPWRIRRGKVILAKSVFSRSSA